MLRESTAIAVEYGFGLPATRLKVVEAPEFFKPTWWGEDHDTKSYEGRCRIVVEAFMRGTLKKRLKFQNMNGRHNYYTKNNGTELWLFKNNPSIKVNICVALKQNGQFFGNSSSINPMRQLASRKQREAGKRGRLSWTGGAQKIQDVLSDAMTMVPFRVFKEAQLDITTLRMIDKGQAEMLELGRERKGKKIQTHFTGAALFTIKVNKRSREIQGKTDDYFLFDIDRNDLKLKVFNPFLSKLSRPATSIADAYASLKPKEVSDAERFLGKEVPRQGEWFFIPVIGEFKQAKVLNRWGRGRPADAEATLSSKGNRPHFVTKLSEEGYVRGKVTHGGHEHKPIELETWHKAVPNTAVQSFTISGSVD